MSSIGTAERPLRVAVIGSGPAGFYTVEHLFRQDKYVVLVDMFERLPTPFGLVRYGVAPDHQKIKNVTRIYEKLAQRPEFRFFGNVEYGKHVTLEDLKRYYHQIVFATGTQGDRKLGIPGEDLKGFHSAREFVAWYNGHPDYTHLEFDLSKERVAVVGVGNVAVDVARILLKTREELEKTDIADYALEALANSNVREVYMLGRRGPAQAAFTPPEIKELGELADAEVVVRPEEAELDELSKKVLEEHPDKETLRKLEIIRQYVREMPTGTKRRVLYLRFLVSPVEAHANEAGEVDGLKLVKNELYMTEAGTLRPRPTDRYEEIPVQLVFRSIGYKGAPLPGLPFHERWGVIWNKKGRVIDPETDQPLTGLYCAGWIKRGATGVIGTNKPDALETVTCMLEDVEAGRVLDPEASEPEAAERLVRERQPDFVSFEDWKIIDRLEIERGKAVGRPRVKFTSVEEMLEALRREKAKAAVGS